MSWLMVEPMAVVLLERSIWKHLSFSQRSTSDLSHKADLTLAEILICHVTYRCLHQVSHPPRLPSTTTIFYLCQQLPATDTTHQQVIGNQQSTNGVAANCHVAHIFTHIFTSWDICKYFCCSFIDLQLNQLSHAVSPLMLMTWWWLLTGLSWKTEGGQQ